MVKRSVFETVDGPVLGRAASRQAGKCKAYIDLLGHTRCTCDVGGSVSEVRMAKRAKHWKSIAATTGRSEKCDESHRPEHQKSLRGNMTRNRGTLIEATTYQAVATGRQ